MNRKEKGNARSQCVEPELTHVCQKIPYTHDLSTLPETVKHTWASSKRQIHKNKRCVRRNIFFFVSDCDLCE